MPFGIKGATPIPKCKSLMEIIQLTGDAEVFDATILKLDCEGVEWDVLTSNSIKLLSQFDQIIVELHNLDRFSDVNFAKMALKNFKKLENDFLVTYLAPNNFTPIVRLANDLLWPFTLEVLLVNKKLVKKSNIRVLRRNTLNVTFKKKNHWHLAPRINLESWYEIDRFT
jgi:thiol-disulfide isomerase/thioredoxin